MKVAAEIEKVALKKLSGSWAFCKARVQEQGIMINLYKMVQQSWRKDVNAQKKVWKRFTEVTPGMRDFSSVDGQERLRSFSLEQNRLCRELTKGWNITKGRDRLDFF